MPIAAVVYGVGGRALTAAERRFFRDVDPLGFILFARNIDNPQQLRALTTDLRSCVGRGDAPILIDQEGGRVARLQPPHWRAAPPAASIGRLMERDADTAAEAARINARLMAAELIDLGITVDCAPVLDLRLPESHDVIGDRAFGADPEHVAYLGRAAAEGFLSAGVIPVIKHVPGHGRARTDSHVELPIVDTPLETLRVTDFAPFRRLNDMPWAMTAHVVFTTVDAERPASTSPKIIKTVIRGDIGFDGVLISDDLSMRALRGSMAERTHAVLDAGCDLVLHCSGALREMEDVAGALLPLSPDTVSRIERATAMVADNEICDRAALTARLEYLFVA